MSVGISMIIVERERDVVHTVFAWMCYNTNVFIPLRSAWDLLSRGSSIIEME